MTFRSVVSSIYLILPATLAPGVYLASNRNEYKKQKNNVSEEKSYGWCVKLKTLPPSVSQLSRHCGILNISQSYRLSQPATRIASHLFTLI
jgi:hypothetical protein